MGKNWAIAIGINQYSYLQSLQFAKTDAEAMERWLLDEGGFDRVFLFTDDSPPIPTQPPIPTSPTFGHLDTFFDVQFENQLLTSGDNLWFFFSGHGNRGREGDYLMLSDSNPQRLERSALSVSYITERLRNWGAGNVVMFIDACRNVVENSRGGAIAMEDYQGIIAFYSCRANEKSLEIQAIEQGAFTHILLRVFAETKQQNCCLTVAELENCLMGEVPKLSPNQHPLARVEPTYKRDFVLFGEAGTNDVESLKNLAYRKCFEGKNEEAKELLIHANLVAKGGDFEVIEALGRLHGSSPVSMPSPQPKPNPKPSPQKRVAPIEIPEIKEAKPEIELKSEKGVDYRKLRDRLAAGQWKEADEETLRVMCKVADRTKEGWLRTEDVDLFPCEDLHTIDRLWVHYSDGKFGFSVQNKIYQELGGTRQYNTKTWRKFGDRVGWRRGGEWLNNNDLTFDLKNVFSAHLPVVGVGLGRGSGLDWRCLFSRTETCNL
ncbi:MAG: GUN4 domain-containing protein [Cyanobacteria bacterium SBLK]|nr:GUN4 domain-containing protein [Cyanobacteria bacterium SBLK]